MCKYTVVRASANFPQTDTDVLFTVDGGKILLHALVPLVTTTVQSQTNNVLVIANPTVGSNKTMLNVGDISGLAAGNYFGEGPTIGTSVQTFPVSPWVLSEGSIDFSCSASNTGQIEWTAIYEPLDPGATLSAA